MAKPCLFSLRRVVFACFFVCLLLLEGGAVALAQYNASGYAPKKEIDYNGGGNQSSNSSSEQKGVTAPAPSMPHALILRHRKQEMQPVITRAWARPAPLGGATAIFFDLEGGEQDDRILSVQTAWAENTYIQRTVKDGKGKLVAQRVERAFVPAKARAKFNSNGLYLIADGIQRGLGLGRMFPVLIEFEKAGVVSVMVEVK